MIKDKKTAIVGSVVGAVILLTIFCCEGNKEVPVEAEVAPVVEEVIEEVTPAVEVTPEVEEVIEEVTPEVEEVIEEVTPEVEEVIEEVPAVEEVIE